MKKIVAGLVLLVLLLSTGVASAAWWDTDFTHRRQITLSHVNNSGDTLTNYPAFINVTKESSMQSDFDDIRFIDNSDNLMAFELENYTASYGLYWVNITSLPNSGQTFWLYYGNDTANSAANPAAVWDSSVKMVQHLQNLNDSTSYNNDATNSNASYTASGRIDGAYDFDGSTSYLDCGNDTSLNISNGAVGLWFNKISSLTNESILLTKDTSGNNTGDFALGFDISNNTGDNKIAVRFQGTGGDVIISDNTISNGWHHVAFTFGSSGMRLYIDSVLQSNTGASTVGMTNESNHLVIGGFYTPEQGFSHSFNSAIDEGMIYSRELSADEINQSYQLVSNQNSFVEWGSIFIEGLINVEITNGVGVILANSTTETTTRQITPDSITVTLNSSETISNYILYIENTDPDLIKAYGSGITQSTHENNTIKLVFDLTQDMSKTIDLHRIWYPTQWSFIVLGDMRPGNDNNSDLVSDQFVDIINQSMYVNPVYPIPNTGDVIGGGTAIASSPVCTEDMHQAYWGFQNNKGIWYAAIGNHDQARNTNPQGSAQVIFDKSWGSSNFSYAFGDWYFIIANSYADDGTAPSESNAHGFLKNDHWDWTESEVTGHNESYNEIVMFHHPLWKYQDGEGGSNGSWQDANSNTNLRNLLVNSGVKLNIVGHEHIWHESTHDGMIQLIEGRGGAPLHDGETVWGFSVVELNAGGVVNITRVNVTDGYSITTIYNNTNDYTKTTLKATIDNGHPMSIPCMLKFRMSDTNTAAYTVTGADYYDIIKNDYGYVVIAQATASSTTEVVVSETVVPKQTTMDKFTDTTKTSIALMGILAIVVLATLIIGVLLNIQSGAEIDLKLIMIGAVTLVAFMVVMFVALSIFSAFT